MRLYLITYGQLKEIQGQEGKSSKWYGRILFLDSINGIPVFTLTSEESAEQTEPSEEYLSLLREALMAEAGMTERETEKYLKSCAAPFFKGKKRIQK